MDAIRSKTALSIYCKCVTFGIVGGLIAGCVAAHAERPLAMTLLAILIVLLLFGFQYWPLAISADSANITVHTPLRKIRITMDKVESVELFQPTMGALRICASGGFMGYWGLFKEGDIGNYTAYYGKASDCFMLRMTNGTKYVLGCHNPDRITAFIASHILRKSDKQ